MLPIIAPPSLSVTQTRIAQDNIPILIKTLNLSRSPENLRNTGLGYTINFVDTRKFSVAPNAYVKPSTGANGLIYSTIHNGRISLAPSPCGLDCSFSQTFFGPAYKCSEVDYAQADIPGNPFPHGAEAQKAFAATGGVYSPYEWYIGTNSTCISGQVCHGDDERWKDGRVWILYRYLLPEAREKIPEGRLKNIPDSSWEKHQIVCQSFNATYTILHTYSAGVEGTITQSSLAYNNPLDYTKERMEGGPKGDMQPEFAGYAIHETLFSILAGHIGPNGRGSPVDETGLAGTQLVEHDSFTLANLTDSAPSWMSIQKPVRFLARAIEQLHFNITVGMLSIPQLIYLQNETVAARVVSTEPRWAYNPLPLLAVYGVFLVASLVSAVLALVAVAGNEGVGVLESGFLRALMTTRSADFDEIVVGEAGKGEDFHQEPLRGVEVRFCPPTSAADETGSEALMGPAVEPVVGFVMRKRVATSKTGAE